MSLLTNRRRAVGKSLPYDAKIEYLESTGTNFIDTDIILDDANYIIKCEFMLMEVPSTAYAALFTNYSNGKNTYGVAFRTDSRFWINAGTTSSSTVQPAYMINTLYKLRLESGSVDINGNTYTGGNFASSYSNSSILLFKQRYNNSLIKARMMSFRIKHNTDIIVDYIPVRIGSVGYLYDKISGQFFGGEGFLLGPDK